MTSNPAPLIAAVNAECARLGTLERIETVGAGRAYLRITPEAVTLTTAAPGEPGPLDEARGLVEVVGLPVGVTPDAVADFLRDETARGLVVRIMAGLGAAWCGSQYCGTLSPDGCEAAEDLGGVTPWGEADGYAGEWFRDAWEAGRVIGSMEARVFLRDLHAELRACASPDEAALLACEDLDADGVYSGGDGLVYVGHPAAADEARRVWEAGRA